MDSHEDTATKSVQRLTRTVVLVQNVLSTEKVNYVIGRTVRELKIQKKNERDGMNDVTIECGNGIVTVVLSGPRTII